MEAEHLAATLAMMKLSQDTSEAFKDEVGEDSERPGLQRSLPLSFRERWQQWEQQVSSSLQELHGF